MNPKPTRKLWKSVRRINAQPRVRNFVWRACRGLLPCMTNLFYKKITPHERCDSCGKIEDELHALFACHDAQKIWRLVPHLRRLGKKSSSMLAFLDMVLASCKSDEIQLWAYVAEAAWQARNRRAFEGQLAEPQLCTYHEKA